MFNWSNWPPEFTFCARPEFPHQLPNLRPHLCANVVSEATHEYNCIAWAAGDTTAWWEPDIFQQYFWPEGVSRDYSLQSYIDAFRTVGYELCDDGSPEDGMEKIVIYTLNGEPKHAARKLSNGNWTSKLGDFEDIEHVNLDCLKGPIYGSAHKYMKHRLPAN
jgi:hypothetical protein